MKALSKHNIAATVTVLMLAACSSQTEPKTDFQADTKLEAVQIAKTQIRQSSHRALSKKMFLAPKLFLQEQAGGQPHNLGMLNQVFSFGPAIRETDVILFAFNLMLGAELYSRPHLFRLRRVRVL